MTAQQIEEQIELILTTETDASRLSRQLFDAGGLFGKLAHTEAERRALTQTPLFRQALERLTELQQRAVASYQEELAAVRANAAAAGERE